MDDKSTWSFTQLAMDGVSWSTGVCVPLHITLGFEGLRTLEV